jgi:hypothetical protein
MPSSANPSARSNILFPVQGSPEPWGELCSGADLPRPKRPRDQRHAEALPITIRNHSRRSTIRSAFTGAELESSGRASAYYLNMDTNQETTLKDRIAELKAIRDQARADAERAEDAIERLRPSITAGAQDIRQAGSQTNADRERRLPPRSPARARSARRGRCKRSSHHGLQKRTAAHARHRFKRKNGGFWRSQFCTEVARQSE